MSESQICTLELLEDSTSLELDCSMLELDDDWVMLELDDECGSTSIVMVAPSQPASSASARLVVAIPAIVFISLPQGK